MLQALLAERFKLVVRQETQEHSVLALVVAKGGPKLKESPPAKAIDPDAPLAPGEMTMDTADGPMRMKRNADGSSTINMGAKGMAHVTMDGKMIHLEADTVTMPAFADMLTSLMQSSGGREVVDMTGLKGSYQVSVEFSMADMIARAQAQMGSNGAVAPDATDPGDVSTMYTSVEKLGLKLESRKAPVEQIVVVSAEKMPTEN